MSIMSGLKAVPPHKALLKIEINFAKNFTKLLAKQRDTPVC